MFRYRLVLFVFIFFLLLDIALIVYFYSLQSGGISTGPGRCLVLEEKYCKEVKFISDPINKDGLLAVYKIPKGAFIYAPVKGYFSKSPTFYFENKVDGGYVTYPGTTITLAQNNSTNIDSVIFSFIYFEEEKSFHPTGGIRVEFKKPIIIAAGRWSFTFHPTGGIDYKNSFASPTSWPTRP